MLIGIDFDNTIVNYEGVFHRVAVKRGFIPASGGPGTSKNAVRDFLRARGGENTWIELQGLVYGPYMDEAAVYAGVGDFVRACRRAGVPTAIISHRTRFPYIGEKHDLHQAARDWLKAQNIEANGLGTAREMDDGLAVGVVHFELTKEEKLARIESVGCTHFIDDLPEFLALEGFGPGVERILFDPEGCHSDWKETVTVRSWGEVQQRILGGQ